MFNASSIFFFNSINLFNSYTLIIQIIIGILLYSLTIWTIIGNIFVVIAIFTNKQLKQGGMSNFLIGNLAISDLLLGLTVLPFSATYSTFNIWPFGKILCDVWLSIDVLCCTASIWGLLVISLDRYIATNHPIRYRKQKNSIKIAIIYCTVSWLISIIISLGPLSFSKDNSEADDFNYLENEPKPPEKTHAYKRIENTTDYECVLFHSPSFVILSSLGSFFLPLIIMFILYAGVFLKIKQQSKLFNNRANRNVEQPKSNQDQSLLNKKEPLAKQNSDNLNKKNGNNHRPQTSMQPANNEARVTKTLVIIMGAFVACWLPFFIIYIIRSQLSNTHAIPAYVMDFFIWLGYFNSSLNPILYAILNSNFRIAFQDILACRCFGRSFNISSRP